MKDCPDCFAMENDVDVLKAELEQLRKSVGTLMFQLDRLSPRGVITESMKKLEPPYLKHLREFAEGKP